MKKFLITAGKALTFFLGWAVLTGLIPFPDSSSGLDSPFCSGCRSGKPSRCTCVPLP